MAVMFTGWGVLEGVRWNLVSFIFAIFLFKLALWLPLSLLRISRFFTPRRELLARIALPLAFLAVLTLLYFVP